MDLFLADCEYFIKNKTSKTQLNENLYQKGISYLLENTVSFEMKKTILHHLIMIYQENPELYYYMGYIHSQNPQFTTPMVIIYWFQTALTQFLSYRKTTKHIHAYELENWLDLLKVLFDKEYTNMFQELLNTHSAIIQGFVNQKEFRLIHILASYYIKTNQLRRADTMYTILLDPNIPKEPELEYQIQNNALILYSRMAKFESLHELLKRNLSICQTMGNVKGVNLRTKQNLFCSNMLQYDYIFHDMEDRKNMCQSLVEQFFPTTPYSGPNSYNNKKIHIGYVSADILHHAVSNFILPILENHDTNKFHIVLFMSRHYTKMSTNADYRHIREKCVLVDIEHMDTDDVVKSIRENQIDVLFDLHGYTGHNRLDVFAKNPAKIQISYLGFPNTVGSSNILKYRFTDCIADPPDSRQWWAEELIYLKGGFLLYKCITLINPVGASRKYHPFIVFGSLNRESKNSPELLECWKQILQLAPHTKLLMKLSTTEDDEIHMEKYRNLLGVSDDRLIFEKYGTTEDYFTLYSHIDILLDCFPYSGTTTTCNALYNSIPVITLHHPDLHSHNVSSSLLHHLGFSELISYTRQEYVEKAVELSKDLKRLFMYRDQGFIRDAFMEWMNPVRFMKEYEGAITDLMSR